MDQSLVKKLITGAACVFIALLIGWVLASPLSFQAIGLVGLLAGGLMFPLMMRWHHLLLITTWNMVFVVFFFPGQPNVGVIVAGISFFFALLQLLARRRQEQLWVPSVGLPLMILGVVVLATAFLTGGIAGRAFGSDNWGAKRYMWVASAIMGYYALTSQAIPRHRAKLYATLFFGASVTAVGSDIAYATGINSLFAIFPTSVAFLQATTQSSIMRLEGLAWASQGVTWVLLARYGIRGLFDIRAPWRMAVFLLTFSAGLFGGFRSSILLFSIVFAVLFFVEGLHRTRYVVVFGAVALLVSTLVIGFIEFMPLAIQRSLSFLPLDIHPMARQDADSTLEWRLQMWKTLMPEVPHYLWLGKGFTFSGTDYLLTQDAVRRGIFLSSYEDTLINGNYHNGILTLLIPFGVFGMAAFLWFCFAAGRVLYRNFHYSSPELKTLNTFLYAYYLGRLIFYFSLYGQFDLDLLILTGAVGLSISLNHGVCGPPKVVETESVPEARPWPQPPEPLLPATGGLATR